MARNKKRPGWHSKTLSQRSISPSWEMGEPNPSLSMPRMHQTSSSCNRASRGRSGRRAGSQHRYETGQLAVFPKIIHSLDRDQALTRACNPRLRLARATRNPSIRGRIPEEYSEALALSRKRIWTQTPQLPGRIAVWISMSIHSTIDTYIAPENRTSCSLLRRTMLWSRKQQPYRVTLALNLPKGKSRKDSNRSSRKRCRHSTSHT